MISDIKKEEIISKRDNTRVENFSITIGELMNMYGNKEIKLNPKFQRLFRWKKSQKSGLIESILLGFPLPSFFFSESDNGVWEILDGLQRISTILEFVGLINDDTNDSINLGIKSYEDSIIDIEGLKYSELDKVNELFFKRYKINICLVKRESTPDIKLNIFMKLNTGASPLSNQEVRNCMIIMNDEDFYDELEKITKENKNFNSTLAILSDGIIKKQIDMELVLRFLGLINLQEGEKYSSINKFLDHKMEIYYKNNKIFKKDIIVFEKTFKILNEYLGEDVFRRFNFEENKFKGGFIYPAFDFITLGIGKLIINNKEINKEKIILKIKSLWEEKSDFNTNIMTKISTGEKLSYTNKEAYKYFLN